MLNIHQQAEELTRALEARRDRHCSEVLARAEKHARAIVKKALRHARLRFSGSVEEERLRLDKRVRVAEARVLTAKRQKRHREQQRLLSLAQGSLADALLARWHDPDARRRWVAGLLERGFAKLPTDAGAWRIAHPLDWASEETAALRQHVVERGRETPGFEPDGAIRAGLRIRSGGVVLDGTLAAMTSDTRLIEARLLALLDKAGVFGSG